MSACARFKENPRLVSISPLLSGLCTSDTWPDNDSEKKGSSQSSVPEVNVKLAKNDGDSKKDGHVFAPHPDQNCSKSKVMTSAQCPECSVPKCPVPSPSAVQWSTLVGNQTFVIFIAHWVHVSTWFAISNKSTIFIGGTTGFT